MQLHAHATQRPRGCQGLATPTARVSWNGSCYLKQFYSACASPKQVATASQGRQEKKILPRTSRPLPSHKYIGKLHRIMAAPAERAERLRAMRLVTPARAASELPQPPHSIWTEDAPASFALSPPVSCANARRRWRDGLVLRGDVLVFGCRACAIHHCLAQLSIQRVCRGSGAGCALFAAVGRAPSLEPMAPASAVVTHCGHNCARTPAFAQRASRAYITPRADAHGGRVHDHARVAVAARHLSHALQGQRSSAGNAALNVRARARATAKAAIACRAICLYTVPPAVDG